MDRIFEKTRIAFRDRNADAALQIEPLEEVADELISSFKVNHLNRMGSGKCNLYDFLSNLFFHRASFLFKLYFKIIHSSFKNQQKRR